jgi:hypothetical protein
VSGTLIALIFSIVKSKRNQAVQMIQAAKTRLGLTFALTLLLGAVAAPANAGFILTLEDPDDASTRTTIADGSALDGQAATGAVSFSGLVGNFWVMFASGVSKPILEDSMDLFSITISGAAGSLMISLTDTDFDSVPSRAGFGIGGTTTGTVEYAAYLDNSNAEFGTGTLLGSGVATPLAFSDSQGTAVSTSGPFSLTAITTITHGGHADITSFDMMVQVPEPGTVSLLGGGLLALGLLSRRRRVRT